MIHGALEGVVNLERVVPAAAEPFELIVGFIGDHFKKFRVLAEEFLADVRAALGFEVLVFAVYAFLHALDKKAVVIAGKQFIPVRSPQALDHVPACAAEGGFQFADNAAVAADRPVQTLQIAIDYEDQIVELFTRTQGYGAQRFGLIGFAVAEEGPYLAVGGGDDAAIFQVAHEARLIERVDGAQAHGDRWELPERRHQPRVRIRRQAGVFAQFMAEIFEVLFCETAFKKRAGVHAGRGVALIVDEIAGLIAVGAVEEVILADFR